jgi:GTPase SAR1 family protein
VLDFGNQVWVVFFAFVVGMAGSGKSLFTAAFSEFLKQNDQDVLALNLDPGATSLPYNPDVDVRNYVSVQSLMEEYHLGPNGALIMASDLIADHIEEIRGELEESGPELVVVDTPGQIELFAFRESGPYVTDAISEEPRAVLYALDGPFSKSPLNFVSNMFLAAAVYSRIRLPQVYAITKADMMNDEDLDMVVEWSTEADKLERSLREKSPATMSLISRDLANAIFAMGLSYESIPVSSKTNAGFVDLNAALTRIFQGGEETGR